MLLGFCSVSKIVGNKNQQWSFDSYPELVRYFACPLNNGTQNVSLSYKLIFKCIFFHKNIYPFSIKTESDFVPANFIMPCVVIQVEYSKHTCIEGVCVDLFVIMYVTYSAMLALDGFED